MGEPLTLSYGRRDQHSGCPECREQVTGEGQVCAWGRWGHSSQPWLRVECAGRDSVRSNKVAAVGQSMDQRSQSDGKYQNKDGEF